MSKCPKCSQINYVGAKTCAFCGEIIDPVLRAQIATEKIREKKLERVLIYTAGMCLVVASLLILFYRFSPTGGFAKAQVRVTETALAKAVRETEADVKITANAVSTTSAIDAYCGVGKVDQALGRLNDLVERWGDAVKLAMSTERTALASQVEQLQAIRREARDIEVPECLDNGKSSLVTSMDAHIEGYLAFMRQEPADVFSGHMDKATREMELFISEVEQIHICMPNCN